MSTPTVLPARALRLLGPAATPAPARFVRSGLARGALYLAPVLLAMAAGEPLTRVPWPVPAGALAAGWCGSAVLTYLGRTTVAAGADAATAARLVLAGFAGLAVSWSAGLALAPAELVGDYRWLAYAVSVPVLGYAYALAVAQVTGAEPALLRWCLPALLVAFATLAGWTPPGGGPGGPPGAGPLLVLVALTLPVARGAALGWRGGSHRGHRTGRRRRGQRHPDPHRARPHRRTRGLGQPGRLGAPVLQQASIQLLLAAGQAALVLLVWRAGHGSTGGALSPAALPPALAPLLVALPAIELWVGWHLARLAAGLAWYDDRIAYQRYLRRLGWLTLAALLPPLVAAAALAATAHRLPYRLSTHPDAPALVLALATGLLLAGIVAVGRLLAGRARPGLAAAVTVAAVLGAAGFADGVPGAAAGSLAGGQPLLAAAAVALAAAYGVGLVLAVQVLFDARGGRGPALAPAGGTAFTGGTGAAAKTR